MSKYIDAEKLIAEINNRLMSVNLEELGNFGSHRVWAYNDVKDLIDSLQQEHPEVDLEKEFAYEYAIYPLPTFILASLVDGIELIDFIHKTARHFYELGKNTK